MAKQLPVSYVKWSEWSVGEHLREARVLMVDTVGDLFRIYGHADMALVGGALGPGLHNILEPLAFGIPICMGPQLGDHWEAHAAIEADIAQIVQSPEELHQWIHKVSRRDDSKAVASFMSSHAGAMDRLNQMVKRHLLQ